MSSGAPDYLIVTGGRTPERAVAYSQIELPIVMFDDFEATLCKWCASAGAVTIVDGSEVTNFQIPVWNGSKCMKIATTVGSGANINRTIPLPEQVSNIGFAFYFFYENPSYFRAGNNQNVMVGLFLYTGTVYKFFAVYYDFSTGKWYYSNDGGATYTLICTREMYEGMHHYVKLLVDVLNDKAVYILIDGLKIKLSDVNLCTEANTTSVALTLFFDLVAAASKTAVLFVDDYKITYNEPE